MAEIIMGLDPGTRVMGYGIIAIEPVGYRLIDYGCVRPPAKALLSDRYLILFEAVEELFAKHRPTALAIETQYVHKNVQSAIKLGMARGVAVVAAKRQGAAIFEYTPSKAKSAVVGAGHASKAQVQGMVQRLLRLTELPEPEDAADALALAICHAQSLRWRTLLGSEL